MPTCKSCACQLCWFNRGNRCTQEEIRLNRDGSCDSRYDIQLDGEYLNEIKEGKGEEREIPFLVDRRQS